jgi:hypothetical protein
MMCVWVMRSSYLIDGFLYWAANLLSREKNSAFMFIKLVTFEIHSELSPFRAAKMRCPCTCKLCDALVTRGIWNFCSSN